MIIPFRTFMSNIKASLHFNVETGEVTKGQLPRKAASIVKEWCIEHQSELLNNWAKALKF